MNDTNKCVANMENNRFNLVLVAAQRARELSRGSKTMIATTSKPCVAALEEIEAGLIGKEYLKKLK